MNKLPQSLHQKTDLGWSIQIYSSDRRLLCALDSSHAWILCLGLILGFLSGLTLNQIAPETTNSSTQPEQTTVTMPTTID